ncbi:coatamer subunit protein [Teratosphaeria destructans]|uniref:Coatamer subunit protein n=1 Tax=Teratosphaeria destructans TaxID=418781 RepID=A0A9W7W0A6_9PEZI|nr:coatamer subunit protein [Teratosphaeria destructans]
MADEQVKEFPDVAHKLAVPKKLSAFEKDRLAAEEKRRRAESENAAALKAFEDSFADEDDDDPLAGIARGGAPGGPRGGGGGGGGAGPGSGYGSGPAGARTGPGSLGPVPGAPPPPPSMKRKRALDEMREAQEARREYDTVQNGERREPGTYGRHDHVDEEQEEQRPRPTIQLSSLPPDMSPGKVEALLQGYVKVHSVTFEPPKHGYTGKRSLTAIATLSAETEKSQIDATISALKDKYMGLGFYLSISQHLSSVALHPSMTSATLGASAEPFGAEKPRPTEGRHSLRHAPPPSEFRGGFAPPESYDSPARGPYGGYGMPAPPEALVNVQVPLDIGTVRAIHVLAERLLIEPDPLRVLEIEAALMADPAVKNDERFAFLYDSRSPAGVYYRHLLWGPDDVDQSVQEAKKRAKGLDRVYGDTVIDFLPPYGQTPFPDLRNLADVVTDMDYNSSDEESDDGDDRRFNDGRDAAELAPAGDGNEKVHLSPLKRARLIHLLCRLPTSNARLRKGDVARITNFAITHAGEGAEEIVDLLLLNIEKPFNYSLAAKYEEQDSEQDSDDYEPGDALPTMPDSDAAPPAKKSDDDGSNSKLIALYIISDILSASSTAGAKNAWKYRQLFEAGFKARNPFCHLGRLDRDLGWGRLKAEQWKRKIGVVFGIWEGWSVFSGDVLEAFKKQFYEPPLTEEEKAVEAARVREEEKRVREEKFRSKFRRVGEGEGSPAPAVGTPGRGEDGMEGLEGPAVSGVESALPMSAEVQEPEKVETTTTTAPPVSSSNTPKAPPAPKRRMRAEDMFASDEE